MSFSLESFLRFVLCLTLSFAFNACNPFEEAQKQIDAEGFGGTDEVRANLRLARVSIQLALDAIERGEDLDSLCNAQDCDPASGVCADLYALDYEDGVHKAIDRKNKVRNALLVPSNWDNIRDFLRDMTYEILPKVYYKGKEVDAKVYFKKGVPHVDWSRNNTSDWTLAQFIKGLFHEAGHVSGFLGLPSIFGDDDDLGDGFSGAELLDTKGACIGAYSTRPPKSNDPVAPQFPPYSETVALAKILAGTYEYNGVTSVVYKQNNQVDFVNEHGAVSAGHVVDSHRVFAEQWNLGGTIIQAGKEIRWDNQSTWVLTQKTPNEFIGPALYVHRGIIAELYYHADSRNFFFVNETGMTTWGVLRGPSRLFTYGWDLGATINANHTEINWDNNTNWNKVPFTNPPQCNDLSGDTETLMCY